MATSSNSSQITIDVGGTIFRTYEETLRRHPRTTLSEIALADDSKRIFFDRNPVIFAAVIEFYRNDQFHVPRGVCPQILKEELCYWKIGVDKLSPCCWNAFYAACDTEEGINTIEQAEYTDKVGVTTNRWKIWRFLDDPSSSRKATVWSYFFLVCLVTSFFVSCCLTTRAFRGKLPEEEVQIILSMKNFTNPKLILQFTTVEYWSLRWIYYICQLIFTLDFFLRLTVCFNKTKFVLSPLNIIDALAILTTLTCVIMRQYNEKFFDDDYLQVYIGLFSVSGLRLLRFIRLSKLFSNLKILIATVKVSCQELFLLLLTLLVFSSIFAGIQFAMEFHNPDTLLNMFDAMWWSIITMTTVGYGDEYPKTAAGKIVGSLCAISGVLIMAMPVAMLAGNFSILFTLQKNKQRHIKMIRKGNDSNNTENTTMSHTIKN